MEQEDEIIGIHESDQPFEEADLRNSQKAFLIDPKAIPENPSKDQLEIRFSGELALVVSGTRRFEYVVTNRTKLDRGKDGYINRIEIWTASTGDYIGSCSCEARKLCKHIIESVRRHHMAIESGFLK